MLKIGTDFSGIGSPEEAIKELGIEHEVEFACEIDKHARKSYLANHKCKKMYEDITTRNHSEVEQLDLYVAGFPCQAFSIAGKQKGFEDVRGTLFFNVADFIRINQPKTFILENVKGLLSHDSGRTFQTIIDLLSNGGGTVNGQMSLDFFEDGLGYHIHFQVLNTKEHGIPQNRERIFIVGFKESRNYLFPKTEPLKIKLKDLLEEEVDEKCFLNDKNIEKLLIYNERQESNGTGFSAKFRDIETTDVMDTIKIDGSGKDDLILVSKEVRTEESKRKRRETGTNDFRGKRIEFRKQNHMNTITTGLTNDHLIKIKSNTKKGFEVATNGDGINYSVLASKTRRGRVGKQISNTIDTCSGQGVVENSKIRRLTPLECFRLQGYSDEFFFKSKEVNSNNQLYKQAGNSITVKVIKKIIKNIYK